MRNSLIKKELMDMNLPTILALHDSKRPVNIPAICTNSASISSLAAEHLMNTGLKNFAYCGFDDIEWSNDRKNKLLKNQVLIFIYITNQ